MHVGRRVRKHGKSFKILEKQKKCDNYQLMRFRARILYNLCRTNRVAFASFISSAYDSYSQGLLREYNLHRVFNGEVRPTDIRNVVESAFKRKYNQRLSNE